MKLWLDDVRVPEEGWTWAKTVDEAKMLVRENRITEMSLDHDLGEDVPTGYDFVCWLEGQIEFCGREVTSKINVHSANPAGRDNMIRAINAIARRAK